MGLGENETTCRRFPRRFAPRNDTSGECRDAPVPLRGRIVPCMALTERRYRRNRCAPFYRYPVRAASAAPGAACRSPTTAGAVGGVPPNLQPAWRSVSAATPHTLAFAILTAAGTGRRCLPEIAPQGHFLALRAQGATAPSGPRNDNSGKCRGASAPFYR